MYIVGIDKIPKQKRGGIIDTRQEVKPIQKFENSYRTADFVYSYTSKCN